ncbi:MAG: hypothetical protein KAU44_04255, partial [Candidatus Marinimicrobia bacterium]|nr:hypothetical protein [Candidatus Neomarinimicrobiota bacterium]
MKKILVILMVMLATFALADINVTYVVNMSTLTGMGATDSTYSVQLCGSDNDVALTWTDASSLTTNVGGDYWELEVTYPDSMVGDDIAYKIRYKGNDEDGYHWENFPGGGDRHYTMPTVDTVLQVAYVNTGWDPPYTPTDSVDVFFRINMSADEGFTETDPLCMVGGLPAGGAGTNMWSPGTYVLTQEGSSDFWNYHLKLDPSTLPLTDQMYRYLNGTEWSDHNENLQGAYFAGNENRGISLGTNDTTIAWVWWNDVPGGDFEGGDS